MASLFAPVNNLGLVGFTQAPTPSNNLLTNRLAANLFSNMQSRAIATDSASISQTLIDDRARQGQEAAIAVSSNYYTGATVALADLSNTAAALTNSGAGTKDLAVNINEFVSTYNTAIGQVALAATAGAKGAAAGDASTTILQQSLASVVTSPQTGSTGSFNQLSQVGITQNSDGTLAVNSAQLNSAISSDPNSVASLFQTNSSFNALGVAGQVGQLAQQFSSPGAVNITALSSSIGKQLQPTTSPRLTEQYNAQRFAPQLGSSFAAFSDTLSILKAQTNSLLLSGGTGGRFG
jgi:hypothetical protein